MGTVGPRMKKKKKNSDELLRRDDNGCRVTKYSEDETGGLEQVDVGV